MLFDGAAAGSNSQGRSNPPSLLEGDWRISARGRFPREVQREQTTNSRTNPNNSFTPDFAVLTFFRELRGYVANPSRKRGERQAAE